MGTGVLSSTLYWLARDDDAGLAAHLDHCRGLWPTDTFVMPHYWILVAETQRAAYIGEGQQGVARIEAALPDLKRSFYLTIPTVRIEIFYPRARCALIAARAGHEARSMLRLAKRDAKVLRATGRGYAQALSALVDAGCAALEDDRDAQRAALQKAVQSCRAQGLTLHALAAEHTLGDVLGGDEGRALSEQALQRTRQAGVADPARLLLSLLPS